MSKTARCRSNAEASSSTASPGMQYLQKATFAQALMERTWMKEQEAKQLFLQITGTRSGQPESACHIRIRHAKAEGHARSLLHVCSGSRLVTVSVKTLLSRGSPLPGVGLFHLRLFRSRTTISMCRSCIHGHGGIGGCRSHGLQLQAHQAALSCESTAPSETLLQLIQAGFTPTYQCMRAWYFQCSYG